MLANTYTPLYLNQHAGALITVAMMLMMMMMVVYEFERDQHQFFFLATTTIFAVTLPLCQRRRITVLS